MKNLASFLLLSAASIGLSAAGCGGDSTDDGAVAEVSQADEAENGLTVNGLTVNGLTVNGLTVNSMLASALTDPASRTVMKYIVGCALPAGQTITAEAPANSGNFYPFSGEVGLYPDWSTGTCPAETCQAWVSACVIARINAVGHVVPLSVRGADLSADLQEQSLYPRADAVFFGNIFTSPQIRYACTPANGALTRTCGQGVDPSACTAVQYLGPCSSFCDTQAADGSFQGCWNTAAPHTGGTAYPASISVFLQADQVVP